MTNGVRTVIKMKNNAYKEYIRSGLRHNYYVRLENLTAELSNLIRDIKTEYHSKLAAKSINSSTSAKTYLSILKTFANSNNEFVTNFFNRFFNQQCTVISTVRSILQQMNL